MSSPPWDQLASTDAMRSISTAFGVREDEFWKSGERTATFIWDHVAPYVAHRGIAVDFGCGIGRVAFPTAKRFDRLQAVDCSTAMLDQLRTHVEQRGVSNIATFRDTECWDTESVDLVYSILTFQHIEDVSEIEAYVRRIGRCLRGVAFLQFDTRPRTLVARAKERLPDWSVPWTWKRGMRRYRRDPDGLRAIFRRCDLHIVRELDPNTALHAFIVVSDPRSVIGLPHS